MFPAKAYMDQFQPGDGLYTHARWCMITSIVVLLAVVGASVLAFVSPTDDDDDGN